jgi:hypothetical protein
MRRIQELPPSAIGEPPLAKCLACGHPNKFGEVACEACGSSLDLKLCRACEAINASKAERCHACGADFTGPIVEKALPAIRAATRNAPRRARQFTLFTALTLAIALFLVYHFYGDLIARVPEKAAVPPQSSKAQAAVPAQEGAQVQPTAAQGTSAEAPTKEATKPSSAGLRSAELRSGARASRSPPASATHSRGGGSAAAVRAPEPNKETTGARAPEPKKETAAALGAAEPLPVDSLPLRVPSAHPRVTHTKALPDDTLTPAAGVAINAAASRGPQTQADARSGLCSEPVAALGLCAMNVKGEGK